MNLNLKPKSECKYDAVSLGEVMLRLDPGEGRIRTARAFRAWEGGGEYTLLGKYFNPNMPTEEIFTSPMFPGESRRSFSSG